MSIFRIKVILQGKRILVVSAKNATEAKDEAHRIAAKLTLWSSDICKDLTECEEL